jgi:hypothetical protein
MSDASVPPALPMLDGVLGDAADDPEDDSLRIPSRYRPPSVAFDLLADAGAFALSQLEDLVDHVREALGLDDPETQG